MCAESTPSEDESNSVPECVGVPSNQSLAEKSHEESVKLDSNHWVETEIHQSVVCRQLASNGAYLEESVPPDNYFRHSLHVRGVTILFTDSAHGSFVRVDWSPTSRNFISKVVMK